MASNYTVSYKKNSTSRLLPAIAIENPQRFGSDPLRLSINLRGIDGRLVYEERYGATVSFVEGMFEVDGTALAINTLLSTLHYKPAPSGGVDAVAVELVLQRKFGVDMLEHVSSGVINFVSRGFAEGELPPEQPFSPVWLTHPGTILDIVEGSTVAASVKGVMSATMSGAEVPYFGPLRVISISSDHQIEAVIVNGSIIPYTRDDDVLNISVPLKNTDVVEIRLSTPLVYSLNYGTLPPGLELSNNGEITGTLGVLPNAKIGVPQKYPIGLRVQTPDGVYRDRRFVIQATPTTESENNPDWVDPEPLGGVQSIGVYTRGSPISYAIQTTAPNGVPGTLVEAPSDKTIDENFSGLPAGVSLHSNGVVSGIIDPTTKTGTHYFAAILKNARGEEVTTRDFSMIVTSPSGPLEPLRFVRWRTPVGPIGTFYEGEVCPIGIKAYSTTGEAVTYSIAPNTKLPDGISINPTTGDLEGVFSHVTATAEITFVARATVGATFVDREFTITVIPRYNSSGAVNVSFRLRRNEAVPLIADYEPLIPAEDFFRLDDPNFGELREPTIYVVGGLRKSDNASATEGPDIDQYPEPVEYVAAAIRNSKFGGPVKLRLGGHKVALAKVGSTVVYEVLYREVIDPLDRAGGFRLNSRGEPERELLPHPQSTKYLYPESIKNLRYDLVLQVGFDAFDPNQNAKLGVNGPENLPMWMKTPQVGSRSSSVLGFVPAMVVAYLKPGAGQRALDKLSLRAIDAPHPLDEANPLAKNHEVSFDQYYLSYDSLSDPTIFDGGRTTFDGDETRFDEYAYQKGKYQRINPKGGN